MERDYSSRFPINGRCFDTCRGTWCAELANSPDWNPNADRILYRLRFRLDRSRADFRELRLWLSPTALHLSPEYPSLAVNFVHQWLETAATVAEQAFFGR